MSRATISSHTELSRSPNGDHLSTPRYKRAFESQSSSSPTPPAPESTQDINESSAESSAPEERQTFSTSQHPQDVEFVQHVDGGRVVVDLPPLYVSVPRDVNPVVEGRDRVGGKTDGDY